MAGIPAPEDPRTYPRLPVELLLAYRPISAETADTKYVKTKTIGIGGVMFEAPHPLPTGAAYHCELMLEDREIRIEARSVYSERIDPELYRNGMEFTALSPQDRELLMNYYMLAKYRLDRGSR